MIAKEKLTSYFEPQKNRRYKVYKFREAKQNQDETLDQFHTRLRTLSQACEFTDVDFEIEQQFITGGISSKFRRKALRDPKYDLKQMILDGRRDEMSSFQSRDIDNTEQTSAYTHKFHTARGTKKSCFHCGGDYHNKEKCPANGQKCHTCGKNNHFASV